MDSRDDKIHVILWDLPDTNMGTAVLLPGYGYCVPENGTFTTAANNRSDCRWDRRLGIFIFGPHSHSSIKALAKTSFKDSSICRKCFNYEDDTICRLWNDVGFSLTDAGKPARHVMQIGMPVGTFDSILKQVPALETALASRTRPRRASIPRRTSIDEAVETIISTAGPPSAGHVRCQHCGHEVPIPIVLESKPSEETCVHEFDDGICVKCGDKEKGKTRFSLLEID